jgi:hypothetical protein
MLREPLEKSPSDECTYTSGKWRTATVASRVIWSIAESVNLDCSVFHSVIISDG